MSKTAMKETLARLVVMAKIDGVVDDAESSFFFQLANKCGFDADEIQEIIESAENVAVAELSEESGKVEYFFQLLIFSLADGELSSSESRYLESLGEQLGFDLEKVRTIIQRARSIEPEELSVQRLLELMSE